jgi:glycosyltransferase involved in cell wall biosynthesis
MTMDSYPFCSIVIPALNEEEFIERCLLSLNDQTYPRDRYEIIVVDNGSSDSTRSIAEQHANRVFEKLDANVGAVRNHGVLKSKGEILICTDSDCLFDRSWIESGVNLLIKNPNHVFGGGLKSGDHATWIEKYWLLNDDGKNTSQQKDLMGSCIFSWRQDFLNAGYFPEDITSGEDTCLSNSFSSNKIIIRIKKEISVVHLGNAKNIISFAKRQIWHSENYIKNFKDSLKDPTFILISLFLLNVIFIIYLLIFNPIKILPFSVFLMLIPAVFTFKRFMRSEIRKSKFAYYFFPMYTVDLLYVASRSLGVLRGLMQPRS